MRANNYVIASLLLVVVFFFQSNEEAQGIRLGNGMIKLVGQLEKTLDLDSILKNLPKVDNETKESINEEESSLIAEGFRKITLCENGHCNSGNNRKLLIATSPIPSSPTPSTMNNEEGDKKGKPMSSNKEEPTSVKKKDNLENNSEAVNSKNLEAALDLVDIAEMDYSPAKRKPPIHN